MRATLIALTWPLGEGQDVARTTSTFREILRASAGLSFTIQRTSSISLREYPKVRMKVPGLLLVVVISTIATAQSRVPAYAPETTSLARTSINDADLTMLLTKIQQEAEGLNADVGKLRIERWKVDSSTKHQASENASSIQRNLTAALPDLINGVRVAPNSLTANFKLYRNLNALYDVLAGLGESTGAFGKREEYDTIGPHVSAFDDIRRSYGDYLQQMATTADNRLLAAQQLEAQAAAAAQQQPPKKIVVDDDQPTPPPKKKTAKKKPSPSASTASSSGISAPK